MRLGYGRTKIHYNIPDHKAAHNLIGRQISQETSKIQCDHLKEEIRNGLCGDTVRERDGFVHKIFQDEFQRIGENAKAVKERKFIPDFQNGEVVCLSH